MEKSSYENIQEANSDKRHIVYTDDFKDVVKDNPGLMTQIRDILKGLEYDKDFNETNIKNINNITISRVKSTMMNRYKIETRGGIFFVKKTQFPGVRVGEKGFDEFKASLEAKEKLDDLPWVEVVDSQLGYKDEVAGYFVSTWNPIFETTLHDYLATLDKKSEEYVDLVDKVQILKDRLVGFRDVFDHNMAYDPESKKIYLFDLDKWSPPSAIL